MRNKKTANLFKLIKEIINYERVGCVRQPGAADHFGLFHRELVTSQKISYPSVSRYPLLKLMDCHVVRRYVIRYDIL